LVREKLEGRRLITVIADIQQAVGRRQLLHLAEVDGIARKTDVVAESLAHAGKLEVVPAVNFNSKLSASKGSRHCRQKGDGYCLRRPRFNRSFR